MRSCPACTHSLFALIKDIRYCLFDDLHIPGDVAIVQCKRCGMIYNHSSLDENDYNKYYQKNEYYLAAQTPGSGGFSQKEQERYQAIYSLLESKGIALNDKVVDFGCGKGGLLRFLGQKGHHELFGVESSDQCRNFLNTCAGITCYQSCSDFKDTADVVILSHVLEHLYNPESTLKQLREMCHSSTTLYIEVPLVSDYLGATVDWQQLYFEHINHFDLQSLKALVHQCGFVMTDHDIAPFFIDNSSSPLSIRCVVEKSKVVTEPFGDITLLNTISENPSAEVIGVILQLPGQISLWGMSQYAQLLLGCYPSLLDRVRFLFDSSPAKIGRSINGIKIVHPNEIKVLGKDDIVMIPEGSYVDEMSSFLKRKGFSGIIMVY